MNDHNRSLLVRLRSVVKLGHCPSAALLNKPNPMGEWSKVDYLLVDAFYVLDSEKCTRCNNPIWLCHSTDNRIEFTVKVRTCYATAELEDYENNKQTTKLSSGEYLIATPIGLENPDGSYEPLPSRHEAYEKMPD